MKHMLFSKFGKFFVLAAALLAVLYVAAPRPAAAIPHVGYCEDMTGKGAVGYSFMMLDAGDVITVSVYEYSGSSKHTSMNVSGISQAHLIVNDMSVDTSAVPGKLRTVIPAPGIYMFYIKADIAVVGDWSCNLEGSSDSESKAGPPAMNLLDGRVNSVQDKDVAAPVALYNTPLSIFSIDPETGDGWLTFSISDEAIEAAGIPVDAPVLLAQGTNPHTGIDIFVYRLPTGEFQINTHYADGTPYVFVWDNNGSSYHLPQ